MFLESFLPDVRIQWFGFFLMDLVYFLEIEDVVLLDSLH